MSNAPGPGATRKDIEALLARENFVYQRMPLPHGLFTRGEDRSATARVIFPERMEGRSVLDVGCCYGFFLYEAQKRGAARLVGLERNPERLRQARLLRDVQGGTIELSDDDFQAVCARESFDDVLLLNVLHHLKEPVTALRTLARAAKRRLIVEFPTPADPKFSRRFLPGLAALLTGMPVIGVSSLAANEQTFLFSRTAFERVLTDHDKLVSKISFVASPKKEKGRLIAICEK